MARSNVEIVYRALLAGQEVAMDGFTLVADDDGKVYFKLICTKNNEDIEYRYGDCWLELNTFIGFCNKLTEEEITIIAANSALTSFNKRR